MFSPSMMRKYAHVWRKVNKRWYRSRIRLHNKLIYISLNDERVQARVVTHCGDHHLVVDYKGVEHHIHMWCCSWNPSGSKRLWP